MKLQFVQIDGPRRHVYIKFVDSNRKQNVLQTTNGQAEYRQDTGEISTVRIEVAGMGTRRVRIANLPPEVPGNIVQRSFPHMERSKRSKTRAGRVHTDIQ